MTIAFIASEVYPYSKTGGLADIAHFLPLGIKEQNHDVIVVTPYYRDIAKYHHQMIYIGRKTIYMGGIQTDVNYFSLNQDGIQIIFIQNMHYFERDRLYGYNDDAERFVCFSFAALELFTILNKKPEILHLNDWQTGMIPYLLKKHYDHIDYFKQMKTILTIHNLEYQGNFDPYVSRFFNTNFDYSYIHFERVNFLKAGIELANKITTVSPNYREEILTPQYGFTLDGALQYRKDDLIGILNGIDYHSFHPNRDKLITKYNYETYKKGKTDNKKQVYERFNLGTNYDVPFVVYIGRYANQKGLWMIKDTVEGVIANTNAMFFFLGSGDPEYSNYFKFLTDKYPNRVGNYIGYNETLAHELYAASDIFMMPSEFEPCGLGQMIAMTYGSLPIVRETGGLKDTVKPYNKFTHEGTGFSFANLSSLEFKEKLYEAISLYNQQPKTWQKLIQQAMHTDFSNQNMSIKYIELYNKILED